MIKFFLDKFRETPGPLKQARLVVGDVIEELMDLAGHYLRRKGPEDAPVPEDMPAVAHTEAPTPAPPPSKAEPKPRAKAAPATKKKASAKSTATKKKAPRAPDAPARTLDVGPELARALDRPVNQKKQEFKVLAILWDADKRGLGDLSAKALSDHGIQLGLVIRHENVRKVIRMQLSGYVESVQNRTDGGSIYHYRITPKGATQFEEKYLQ